MTFEIDVSGRTRVVTVERMRDGAHRFRLTIDGVERLVDAVSGADGSWSLLLAGGGAESGQSHDVAVTRGSGPGELVVSARGLALPVTVNGRRMRRGGDSRAGAGAQRVSAPMPGKVLRVMVEVGDTVTLRQPLVVVEAMKMENEMTSPKAGIVKEVSVRPGASVEAGRTLIVVD